MSKRAVGYYFLSFGITMLIIIPVFALVGAYRYSELARVDAPVDTVPVTQATSDDEKNILLVLYEKEPQFIILRFDAFNKKISILALPSELLLNDTTVASHLSYAGPGLVVTEIEELLNTDIDYYYMLSKELLLRLCSDFHPVVAGEEISERFPALYAQNITPSFASSIITTQTGKQELLMRSVTYSLLVQQNLDVLHENLTDSMRDISGEVRTNITATDLYTLEDLFMLLRYSNIDCYAATLYGEETEHGIIATVEELEKVAELLETDPPNGDTTTSS